MTDIKLFNTPAHECPYLDGEIATTQFINPDEVLDIGLYTYLSRNGFRRSGEHIYRPRCEACQACKAIRVLVEDFQPSKSQKRCLRRGQQFSYKVRDFVNNSEHYQLYESYIEQRHADGDMYPAKEDLYERFLYSDWARTQFLEAYDQDKLIACAVFDQLFDGLSAVYCYFAEGYDRYSLGKLAILKQIEHARSLRLPYLYLGFQIEDCQKMNYKSQYQPAEQLVNNQWQIIT